MEPGDPHVVGGQHFHTDGFEKMPSFFCNGSIACARGEQRHGPPIDRVRQRACESGDPRAREELDRETVATRGDQPLALRPRGPRHERAEPFLMQGPQDSHELGRALPLAEDNLGGADPASAADVVPEVGVDSKLACSSRSAGKTRHARRTSERYYSERRCAATPEFRWSNSP